MQKIRLTKREYKHALSRRKQLRTSVAIYRRLYRKGMQAKVSDEVYEEYREYMRLSARIRKYEIEKSRIRA